MEEDSSAMLPLGGGRYRIAIVLGTRPEAIKLAPVVLALGRRAQLETVVVSTGQHREMLAQVFDQFSLAADVDLDLMTPGQSLNALASRVLASMDRCLDDLAPDLVMVQGDTTTAFAAALAAFHRRIPVAHVEAGLRSGELGNPFPEEANRRLASVVTELHFAPTELARERLVGEGVDGRRIAVTGNTVVDALEHFLELPFDPASSPLADLPAGEGRRILVTSHRRESWGRELENICLALRDLVELHPDVHVVYPVHLNPRVKETVESLLSNVARIHLVAPVAYLPFIHLMKSAHLILTDSGGVQEEAPTLGKPLLLMRELTERPEAFTAGTARIVGTRRASIVREASRLLCDPSAYRAMACAGNPYGDGLASERIAEAIVRWKAGATDLLDPGRQFRPSPRELAA